jgi:riboflavin biosynthesis pyrimidine reductase
MTQAGWNISPRIGEFTREIIPLEEVQTFYGLDQVTVPEDRPYAWSNTVATLDGVIGTREPGTTGGKEISLGHIPNSGSGSDWRVLNAGWAHADAVLASGAEVREEPDGCVFYNQFEDLQQYREEVLKRNKYPLKVVVTRTGDLPLTHPLFVHSPMRKILATTSKGAASLLEQARKVLNLQNTGDDEVRIVVENKWMTRFLIFEDENSGVDLVALLKHLRQKENVKYLDVSCGSTMISQLIKLKMLDEYRMTKSGCILGHFSTAGEPRVLQFDPNLGFNLENSPLLHFKAIRIYGEHHMFVRGVWQYRH